MQTLNKCVTLETSCDIFNDYTSFHLEGQRVQDVSSYLTRFPDHDVVTMPVPYSQNVCGYTVACTGQREFLNGLIQFIPDRKIVERKIF